MNLSKEAYILLGAGAILVSWKYTRRVRVISFILLRRVWRSIKNYVLNKPQKQNVSKKNDDLVTADDDTDNDDEDSDEEEEKPPL